MNEFTSHDEKHIEQSIRSLRSVRRSIERNSNKIQNWILTQEKDQKEQEETLAANDALMEAIDSCVLQLERLKKR